RWRPTFGAGSGGGRSERDAAPLPLELRQEREQRPAIFWRELTEAPEDRLGFTAVSEHGVQDRASAAVVEEPWPRPESPEGRGAPVAAAGLALDDLVVEV